MPCADFILSDCTLYQLLSANKIFIHSFHTFRDSGIGAGDITVYLGRDTQDLSNPNEVSRTGSQLINHPNYDDSTMDNDMALIKLSSSVTFTNYIRPVCLAADGSVFSAGIITWVTGWGNIGWRGETSFSDWTLKIHKAQFILHFKSRKKLGLALWCL